MSKITLATYLLANLFAILIIISASAKPTQCQILLQVKPLPQWQYNTINNTGTPTSALPIRTLKSQAKMVMYTVACEADLFAVAGKGRFSVIQNAHYQRQKYLH